MSRELWPSKVIKRKIDEAILAWREHERALNRLVSAVRRMPRTQERSDLEDRLISEFGIDPLMLGRSKAEREQSAEQLFSRAIELRIAARNFARSGFPERAAKCNEEARAAENLGVNLRRAGTN